jgi:hypothetical protein
LLWDFSTCPGSSGLLLVYPLLPTLSSNRGRNVVQLQQTDTAAVDGAIAACSGRSAGSVTDNRTATKGGTVGTSTPGITFSNTDVRCLHYETAPGELDGYAVLAGNWVYRCNVTTGAVNTILDEVWVCRVNSAGVSQSTIGSATGLAISCNPTGVKTVTITGSADTAQVGDKIYIVVVFAKTLAGTASLTIKNDQLIDTPMVVASAMEEDGGMLWTTRVVRW